MSRKRFTPEQIIGSLMRKAFQPSGKWIARAKAHFDSRAGRPLTAEESDRLLQSLQDFFDILMRWTEEHPEIVSKDRSELDARM